MLFLLKLGCTAGRTILGYVLHVTDSLNVMLT